jgi:hypothetical protein
MNGKRQPRHRPSCHGVGKVITLFPLPKSDPCTTCDGLGWIMPVDMPDLEHEAERRERLHLEGRATSRHGDLVEHDRWINELAADAEARSGALIHSLQRRGPLDQEPRLLVMDLNNVVILLKEALL